jgi:hypothetical protein
MRLGLLQVSLTALLFASLSWGVLSDGLPQVHFNLPSASTNGVAADPTATIHPSSASGRAIRVVGTSDPRIGYDSYLGVPFARPPVGELRWRSPRPPTYDVREDTVIAQEWSPACAHAAFPEGDLSRLFDMIGKHGMAEDCLYLNVFTPSKAPLENNGPLPVMVWV